MATLYDITGRALALMQMADDEDIEPEVFKDTLDGIEGEFDDKIETYCKVIKNIEADAKAVAEELKRLQSKKKHLENTVSRMKETILEAMRLTGKTSSGGKVLKATIQKNGGVLPLIMDDPVAEALPEEFRITKYEANNEAIRKALDEGIELPFAHYGERGESIRIK